MNIIERPLKAGSKTNNPELIIVHSMGEYINLKSGPKFAPNFLEDVGFSAHALIIPNSDVMICRQPNQGAYHAKGFNTDSLGVEVLVPGGYVYGTFLEKIKTDWCSFGQYQALAELVSSWCHEFNIDPFDKREKHGVKRHSDVSPERKVDPGEGFKWEEFKELLS